MIYKSFYDKEAQSNLTNLDNFDNLKKLADDGFIDLQFEVGKKYINEKNISDGFCYMESSAEQGYKDALEYLGFYYFDNDKELALYYFNKISR